MHVGLIVGIGPAATDFYYRSLIGRMAESGTDLDLTMAHADTRTLLQNQASGDANAQVAIYARLGDRLEAAGARSIAVTSIGGHFCIDDYTAISPLPIINLLQAVNAEVSAQRYGTVALLGTRGVMESGFYGALSRVDVLAPAGDDIDAVHDAYVSMAQSGVCTEAQRRTFFEAGLAMVKERGAEAVLLAGTDLALAFGSHDPGFPVIDCASVHVAAITVAALTG